MKKYISPCFLFLGVLTLAASLFIGYYFVPYKVREKVLEQSKIVRGNTRFKNWEKLPIPLFQKIYLFNVTNPNEVIQGGRPILQEIGPYVYQQRRQKFDIVFNPENDTIFYRERTDYFFRPDLSGGLESDRVTTINIPYVSIATKAAEMNMMTRYVVVDLMKAYSDLQLYVNLTVGELLFDGYFIPFMKELAELRGEQILPNNTFGLYYGKNGSDAGRFEIFSGEKYPEKFGNVVSWNGISELEWWNDQYCNTINGSDGAVFRPFASRERSFNLFIPGLCQSLKFTYDSDGMDVKGVPVIKFAIGPRFFESGKSNPENRCYCKDPEDVDTCAENGVFRLAGCGKGAMALSQPHFYQGSELYVNQSIGLNPSKERHEMAIYLEPYTSASAKINLRFQMNVDLKPIKFFRPLKKIPTMVHPIFWIDQSVEMPDEPATVLKDKLYGTINMASLLTHVGLIVGSGLTLLALVCFFLCSSNNSIQNSGKEKVECVSYHPQGTLPNGKIILNGSANGNGNAHNDSHNYTNHASDHPESDSADPTTAPLLISTEIPLDNSDEESFRNPESLETTDESSRQSNLNTQPDSRLSPFPSATDYPSNLSITAANRELVEAVSSYENI